MWYSTMKEQRDFLLHERKALLHTRKTRASLQNTLKEAMPGCIIGLPKVPLHMTLLTGCTSSTGCTIEHALPIQATRW
jgi:hypothetical protein